jgi:hypothetical protein
MSQNSIELKVLGADKSSVIVFSSAGTTPLPASAGGGVVVTKNAASQVAAIHGTVSGSTVVFDSPA